MQLYILFCIYSYFRTTLAADAYMNICGDMDENSQKPKYIDIVIYEFRKFISQYEIIGGTKYNVLLRYEAFVKGKFNLCSESYKFETTNTLEDICLKAYDKFNGNIKSINNVLKTEITIGSINAETYVIKLSVSTVDKQMCFIYIDFSPNQDDNDEYNKLIPLSIYPEVKGQ